MSSLVEFPPETYKATAFRNFNPDTSDFTIDNARSLMWAAQLAYENDRTIKAVEQTLGFESVDPFVERKVSLDGWFETRGIIGKRSNAVVLAFGGTDPAVWENLATDFNLHPVLDKDVHTGFRKAAAGVAAEIDRAIRLSRDTKRPLFVTGHSLGGAIAVLAAQRAAEAGTTPKAVYTFGLPRVGREAFRTAYNDKLGPITYRLVHGQDIVASVPMSEIRFRHVGRALQCKSGEKFDPAVPLSQLGSDEPAFSKGVVNSVVSGIAGVLSGHLFQPKGLGPFGPLFKFLPQPIRDHLQDRYLTALGDNVTPP
jgi:triacylglycerol lipase